MLRLPLYIFGISTVLTAWALFKNQQRSTDPRRRIPVKEAAALLQEAWADHHTRAWWQPRLLREPQSDDRARARFSGAADGRAYWSA